MRLWHIALLPVLPREQLLGQWGEICLIAKRIRLNGTPGHILVNWVMEYPPEHLDYYARAVAAEMKARGYKCNTSRYWQWRTYTSERAVKAKYVFQPKMGPKYLVQCYMNLDEKADCGGIAMEDMDRISDLVAELTMMRYAG